MLLLPVRPQIELNKWPVMTLIVSAVCLLTFYVQLTNLADVQSYAEVFCAQPAQRGIRNVSDSLGRGASCEGLLVGAYTATEPEYAIRTIVQGINASLGRDAAEVYRAGYEKFLLEAPEFLTGELWHDRDVFNPIAMVTSSLTHASWGHVIGNLIFFFAFAAIVEIIIGPVLFSLVFLLASLGIGGVDFIANITQSNPGATLGLSGVVMTMMVLAVFFVPHVNVSFFYWWFVFFGVINIPGWIVAIWFIAWDAYYQFTQVSGHVNYLAHLTGAALGGVIGFVLFRKHREWGRSLTFKEPSINSEQSALQKYNAAMAMPFMVAMLTGSVLLGVWAVSIFIESFAVQLLLLAPAALAIWQIYRLRNKPKMSHRYERVKKMVDGHAYDAAVKHLHKLNNEGYTPAFTQLAELYATGRGVMKDEKKAVQLYMSAAERGSTDAQYALATCYMDGRGLPSDQRVAKLWYEKAARKGHAQAAMGLGYVLAHGIHEVRDLEAAVRAYALAVLLFHRQGRREDAEMALELLKRLMPEHELVAKAEWLLSLPAKNDREAKNVEDPGSTC